MLCLLSPAKTFRSADDISDVTPTQPAFWAEANQLVSHLKTYDENGLKELMHLSEKLAALNVDRYQNWDQMAAKPALFAYHGDVYKGVKHTPLTAENWQHANAHIAILSGLYGVLRATDAIGEHRLEMGTKLVTDGGKNLYDFWGEKVTHQVNKMAAAAGAKYVLHLASNEYFKAIKPQKLATPLVTVQFLDFGKSGYKTVAIYAKRSRGLMARYVLDNRIKEPSQLVDFNAEGYRFSPEKSDETTVVFTRKKR